MSCFTLQGISDDLCSSSLGGLSKIAIVDFSGFEITTVADGEITAMTSSAAVVGYSALKDQNSFTEAIVGDGILANIHWEPSVNLVFKKMSADLRNEILELTKGYVVIFITDNNDVTWAIGTDRGMTLGDSTGGNTGLGMTELNGVTLTFKGIETYPAYAVDLTAVGAPWDALLS